jgi:hypothetical protein
MGWLDDDDWNMSGNKQKLAEAKKKLANAELYKSICVVCAIICSLMLLVGLMMPSLDDGIIFILFSIMGLCLCGMFFPTGKDSPEFAKDMVEERRRELRNQEMMRANRNRERIQAEEEKQRKLGLAANLLQEGGLANLQEVLKIYSVIDVVTLVGGPPSGKFFDVKKEIAQEKEKLLDYAGAIAGFEELGLHKDAKRVRRKMLDEKKVDQTVVHGDYVDDRDTIIKDSVISKSSIGAGGDDKFARLERLTEMKKEGLIDDDEFQQMKKEILGK